MIPSFEDITCFLTARYASWKRSSSSRPCIETFSFSLSYMRLNHSLNSLRSLVAIIVCFLCETLRSASAGTLFSLRASQLPECRHSVKARQGKIPQRSEDDFSAADPAGATALHGDTRRLPLRQRKQVCFKFHLFFPFVFTQSYFGSFQYSIIPFAVTRTDTWRHVSAHPLHISILYISLWRNIKF